jgi:Ser/Thr protein kinase RdoA (MazF antagonist)
MIAHALGPRAWPALYESGRLLCTGQPCVADYATRALLIPYGRRRRVATTLLRRLPAFVRRHAAVRQLTRAAAVSPNGWRRAASGSAADAGVAADQMAMLVVALREMPVLLAETPLHDWDGSHWIALRDHGGFRRRERIVLFLFRPGEDVPAAVLKLRRAQSESRSLAAEHAALRALRPLDAAVIDSVPEPLAFRTHAGLETLLLSALPGPSTDLLLRAGSEKRTHRHLLAGLDWLGRFHRATRQPGGWRVQPTQRARALYRLQQLDDVPGHLAPLAEALESRAELPLTMACGHGDFWPRNVVVREDRRGVGVVDWEHFTASAPCAADVFHYVVTWTLRSVGETAAVSDAHAAAVFAEAVHDRARSAALRVALHHYCAVSGMPHAELESALPLCLLTRPLDQSADDDEREGWSDYAAGVVAGDRPAFLP